MTESTQVNPQVIDVINQAQAATMGAQVVLTSGAGKAYQSVAQSTAIAVQDATDALRNISTIATTAAGVAMAQMLAGNEQSSTALQAAQEMMSTATQDFSRIGAAAAAILREFPSG
jgi:methylphosphotriester-DNA--protein-cysteine methyltransferase